MARFILPRGTVNYPSMSVFFWERVEKMHACKLISSVVLASLLFGSPVIADPGVVVVATVAKPMPKPPLWLHATSF